MSSNSFRRTGKNATMLLAGTMPCLVVCCICVAIGLIVFSLSSTPLPDISEIARMGRVDEPAQGFVVIMFVRVGFATILLAIGVVILSVNSLSARKGIV